MPASISLYNGTMTGNTYAAYGAFLEAGAGTIGAVGANNTINAGNIGLAANLTLLTPSATDAVTVSGYLGATSASSGAPIKAGSGLAALGGNNIYTGSTTISGGTLQLPAGGVVNNGSQFLVGSSGTGTLLVNGGTLINTYNGNHGLDLGVNGGDVGTVTLSSGTIALNGSSGLVAGANGTGTFNQTGGYFSCGSSGVWIGDGASSAVGTLNLSGGTFVSTAATTIVGTRGTGTVNVSGSANVTLATLQMGHTAGSNQTEIVNLGGGTLTVAAVTQSNGTGTFNFNGGTLVPSGSSAALSTVSAANVQQNGAYINTAGYNVTIGQALLHSGTNATDGGLTKLGAGILSLSGSSNYNGGTNVNGGTLEIGAGGATGSVAGAISVAPSTTLAFYNNNSANLLSIANSISGSGTISLLGNGTSGYFPYQFTTSETGFSGNVVVNNARLQGTLSNVGSAAMLYTVDNGSDGGQVYGVSNTFTNPVTIAGQGWQEMRRAAGALRIENATWNGSITLSGNARIGSYGNYANYINGTITGPYQLEFWGGNGTPSYTLTPSAANTYGSTVVTVATVIAGNANAFSTGGLLMNSGILETNGFNFSFANLNGQGGTVENNSSSTASTVTVGSDNTNTTYAGTLANGGAAALALAKTGTGTLTLTGGNTFTGGTTVLGGNLFISSDGTSGGAWATCPLRPRPTTSSSTAAR